MVRLFPAITVLLALAVNLQLTPGVRVAASDIVVAGLIPCLVLAARKVRFAPWAIGFGIGALVLLAGLLNGPMDKWAMTKFAGWFVLIGYAASGLLLRDHFALFARVYVFGLCALVAIFVILSIAGIHWSGPRDPRFSGLIGNPNAFALALLCGVIIARDAFTPWEPAAAVLSAGILFSWSMAGIVALAVIAVLWVIWSREALSLLRACVIAALVFFSPVIAVTSIGMLPDVKGADMSPTTGLVRKFSAVLSIGGADESTPDTRGEGTPDARGEGTPDTRGNATRSRSVEARLRSGRQALDLWKSAPVTGAGLGAYWHRYRDEGMIIHSTPLWLLTETGLIGLAAFSGLFFAFAWVLWTRQNYTGLLILAGWTVMAIPHELLYQRIPWLVLGFIVFRPGNPGIR